MPLPDPGADDHRGPVQLPTTFEELGELTFDEALEAFDDRYEEHRSEEEERVRKQADPNWAQEVLAKRQKVGVKFSEEQLTKPPQPYPAANYSRKWEIEHDLLETRSCIKTTRELVERFRAGAVDHTHYFGIDCTLEQAIKNEEDRAAKLEEDLKLLEWELAWLTSSTAFDFTGETCQSDPEAINGIYEEGDALNFQLNVEQGSRSEWFDLTKEQLAFLRKFDRAVYHAGDAVLPEYIGEEGQDNPLVQWIVAPVANRSRLELCTAGREIAKRDPTFWPRLRDIGPTPGLLREANHILRGAGRQEGTMRKRGAVGNRTMHLFSRARTRTSKCSSPRVRGSRRVPSRSAGGGSSGDDPGGGDPEPGERPRRRLARLALRAALLLILFGGLTVINDPWGDGAMSEMVECSDSSDVAAEIDFGFLLNETLGSEQAEGLRAAVASGDAEGCQRVLARAATTGEGWEFYELRGVKATGGGLKVFFDRRPSPPASRADAAPSSVPPRLARPRSSRGCSSRAKGSRRGSARPPSGSSDDPDPEPLALRGIYDAVPAAVAHA